MGLEDKLFLFGVVLLVLTALLPLVPAVVIYMFFPDTKVAASGPLAKLSIRATGAFAAYLIVLMAVSPFSYLNYKSLAAMSTPVWTIKAKLVVMDPADKEVRNPSVFEGLTVTLDPEFFESPAGNFLIKVPELDKRIPKISLNIPTIGQETLDVTELEESQVSRDEGLKEIKVKEPIRFRQIAATAPYPRQPVSAPQSPVEGPLPPPPSQ